FDSRCVRFLLSSKAVKDVQNITYYCFFFQAEDGIRDRNVTGVQTCALPICAWPWAIRSTASSSCSRQPTASIGTCLRLTTCPRRSEERRVGKECRSGWSRYQEKQNNRAKEQDAFIALSYLIRLHCLWR